MFMLFFLFIIKSPDESYTRVLRLVSVKVVTQVCETSLIRDRKIFLRPVPIGLERGFLRLVTER